MDVRTCIWISAGAISCLAAVKAEERRFELPVARVTLKVVDESNTAIAGAKVALGFRDRKSKDEAIFRGETDTSGLLTAEGGCAVTGLGNEISKPGYYSGWADIPVFRDVDGSNHWLPWDHTYTVVLRKIVNPIPMYAKTAWIEIPAVGKPCGYDLEKGDWVAPYGKGVDADLTFNLVRRYADRRDFDVEVELRFSNPGDGVQEAQLAAVDDHTRTSRRVDA